MGLAAMKPLHVDVRPLAAASHDVVAIALALMGAAQLLDGNGITDAEADAVLAALTVAIPLQIAVNVLFGLYQLVYWSVLCRPRSPV